MLPAVATERQVTKQILVYTWLTVLATLVLALATGWLYAAVAVVAGVWFLAMAHQLYAGVPMLPVVATPAAVAVRIVAYSWVMVGSSLLLLLTGSGAVYGAAAVVLGGMFLREAHLLRRRVRRDEPVAPMRLFHWSITYLALLFVAVAADQLL